MGYHAHLKQSRSGNVWCHCLGHCRDEVAKDSVPHIHRIKVSDLTRRSHSCDYLAAGRSVWETQKELRSSGKQATKTIEHVYTGLVGPTNQQSHRKSKYFVALLVEFWGHSLVNFMFRRVRLEKRYLK